EVRRTVHVVDRGRDVEGFHTVDPRTKGRAARLSKVLTSHPDAGLSGTRSCVTLPATSPRAAHGQPSPPRRFYPRPRRAHRRRRHDVVAGTPSPRGAGKAARRARGIGAVTDRTTKART